MRSVSMNKVSERKEIFIKTYGGKTPLWKYYIRSSLDRIGIRQPVEYYNTHKRLQFEVGTLQLWKAYKLDVPSIVSLSKNKLHLSKINGKTLQNLLSESDNLDGNILAKLFGDLNARHKLAFRHKEPRFCHIDANLGNIIFSNNTIFHIDFEMGREYEDVELWAQREVSKLLLCLLEHQTPDNREEILKIFRLKYSFITVVMLLVESVNNRISTKFCRYFPRCAKKSTDRYNLRRLALDMEKSLRI